MKKNLELDDCSNWCCSIENCVSFDWAPSSYTRSVIFDQCYLYGEADENSTFIGHDCGEYSHYLKIPFAGQESTLFWVILAVPLLFFILFCTRQCFGRSKRKKRTAKTSHLVDFKDLGGDFKLMEDQPENSPFDWFPVGILLRAKSVTPLSENTSMQKNYIADVKGKHAHSPQYKYDERLLDKSERISDETLRNIRSRLLSSTSETRGDLSSTDELKGNAKDCIFRSTNTVSSDINSTARCADPSSAESISIENRPTLLKKWTSNVTVNPKVHKVSHQPQQSSVSLSVGSDESPKLRKNVNAQYGSGKWSGFQETTLLQSNESHSPAIYKSFNQISAGIFVNKNITEKHLQRSFEEIIFGAKKITFDEIKLTSKVGSGNAGDVWLGKYCHMDVALKRCKKEWKDMTIEEQYRFLHEIELTISSSGHQNVIRIYGYCTEPNVWIVMEYCKCSVLSLLPLLSISQRLEVVIGLARGLTFIHRQNIVHRDIAARNLLLGSGGETKIIDFGRSRRVCVCNTDGKCCSKWRQPTIRVGPVKWMSPEELAHNQYSKKSDVWSFGITVWEIYTGQEPFPMLAPLVAAKIIVQGGHPNISLLPYRMQLILKAIWTNDIERRPTIDQILTKLITFRSNPFE